MNKSNCKQTVAWCYEHGKSFEFGEIIKYIYNINKLGADINLKACCSVGEDEIMNVADREVYYFNPLCDLSDMEEDKKYIVTFNNDKFVPQVLKVLEKTSSAVYFTNGMCHDLDGLDITIFPSGDHDIRSYTEIKE